MSNDLNLELIIEEVIACETIQHRRNESDYSKEQSKIGAYNEIKRILFGSKEVGVTDDDD